LKKACRASHTPPKNQKKDTPPRHAAATAAIAAAGKACRVLNENLLFAPHFEEGLNLFDLPGQPRYFALQFGKSRHNPPLWAEQGRIRVIAVIECRLCSQISLLWEAV